jgi:hypothetical protein
MIVKVSFVANLYITFDAFALNDTHMLDDSAMTDGRLMVGR